MTIELIRYFIIGVGTTAVSYISYWGLCQTVCEPVKALELQVANVVSWVCAISFAFWGNRCFVFANKSKHAMQSFLLFALSRVFTLLIDMALMFVMVSICGFPNMMMKILVSIVVTVLNYFLTKHTVGGKNKPKSAEE